MLTVIVALLAFALVTPAHAQVEVHIGIHLPAPPRVVVVPEVPTVQVAPTPSANLFFYNGQYWAFVNGGWYLSRAHSGPWILVAPQFVPRPILLVPLRYYHAPPAHWGKWDHRRPPQWGDEWGREWAHKRGWKARGHERGGARGRGHRRGR